MLKRNLIGAAVTSLVMVSTMGAAMAQSASPYSSNPIYIPLEKKSGETSDLLANIFADGVKKLYGQTVEIENNHQQGGKLALNSVMNADPDGLTFTITNVSTVFNDPANLDTARYSYIANIASTPQVLAVPSSSNIKEFKTFEQEGKKLKTEFSIATSGKGSAGNLNFQNFKKNTNFDINHISYGTTDTIVSNLETGKVNSGYTELPILLQAINEGKIHPIAVSSLTRSKDIPSTPTFKELGFGIGKDTNFGIVAPSGITPEVRAQMTEMIERVLKDAEVASKLEKAGFKVNFVKDDAFQQQVKQENATYGEIFKTVH